MNCDLFGFGAIKIDSDLVPSRYTLISGIRLSSLM